MVAARNLQKKLRELGTLAEITKIQALIKELAQGKNGRVMKIDEEFRYIFSIFGARNYGRNDLQEAMQAYWRPFVQDASPRQGVDRVLRYLRMTRLNIGLVANIWSGGMNPVLERLKLEKFFDAIIASADVGFRKPDQRIFKLVLNRLQLLPKEALMVGDTPTADIQGANRIGIRTVRLMRGPNRTKPDLVNPNFKIRNLSAIRSIIDQLLHKD